ncbi:MAG: hypothetical protein WAN66_06820 [Limnoraphis robusta]|nr:hypothetical protein [Limnoraphis robusta]
MHGYNERLIPVIIDLTEAATSGLVGIEKCSHWRLKHPLYPLT